jgi:hypothetical protein
MRKRQIDHNQTAYLKATAVARKCFQRHWNPARHPDRELDMQCQISRSLGVSLGRQMWLLFIFGSSLSGLR